MTFLAILGLLFGIFLVFDGAFNRGLLATLLSGAGAAAVAVIRITEVVTGGVLFILLGLLASTASKC